ncbi:MULTISPECIES: HAD family hydrolase [Mesobacillus]|uniref:L-2-haloalkanoic acid dehalogenase n=2 Tax=Mesobacillus TaxID=2675231 RepID=A0A0D6ZCD3_9BACI|nr:MULTISPECIES: HAD family hydrolase [Mesobacillus]KIY23474.1 L-2-haloalkanoic acid dehalogenase [Mesobacillus subterraneus]MDQ0415650.1 putative hydrolase of the HAD superfamily [Mesobacillus stamsii]
MIKAVIFDLDGTLLNRDASVLKFIENQYERFNGGLDHIPKELYISRFIELDCRGYVWKDKVYQQMVNEFNIGEISWERLLQDYISEFYNSCIPFSNLVSTIESLKEKSIRLGLITNGKGQFQMDNIRAMEIEDYFDTIVISEWEGIKKPNPEIFQKALRELGVSANESMYVGDHPENDVIASMTIGMVGIWKKDNQWDQVEADFIIDDLKELLLIIEEVNKRL